MFNQKKPNPTLERFATPLLAGARAGTYNMMMEKDAQFSNMSSFARYGAIAAAANFLSNTATSFLIPEFHNANLRNLEKVGLSAAGTALLNILGQSRLASPKDFRTTHNAIAGALGGGAAPMVSHQVLTMF